MHISNELRVGIMFFTGLVLLVLMIATLTRWGQSRNAYVFTIRFAQAGGIHSGADVRVAGVKVGQVGEITLDPHSNAALINVRVDKRVNLFSNYQYKIGMGGIVGERYIEITPATGDGKRIEPGQTVDGADSADINQLIGNANTIITKLSQTTDSLNTILGDKETQANFKQAVTNLQQTMASSAQFAKELNGMAQKNRGSIDLIIADLQDVSGDIRRVSNCISPQVENSKILSNMELASANAAAISQRIDRITASVEILVDDKTVAADLRTVMGHLKQASLDLQNTMADAHKAAENLPAVTENLKTASADLPQITKPFKDVAPETAENIAAVSENLRSASEDVDGIAHRISKTSTALGSLDIQPEARLMLVSGDDQSTRSDLNVDFYGKSNMLRLGVADIGNDSGINTQFGNRIRNDLWFRYGVVQSRFGLGADYQPANKRWRISGDLFDPELVRANLIADYQIRPDGWWLSTGFYNIFHENQFGLGVTYRR